MLLAVDVGNTQTVFGLFDGASLTEHWRIATGGLAELIAPHAGTIELVDPFLTLEGLRLVWERNR